MSILSNLFKSPVIGGMAQQFNANADLRRQQDAEREQADYKFKKDIELADYRFDLDEKAKKAERTFETAQLEKQLASKEKIAGAELTAKQAAIPNYLDLDLTDFGHGKFVVKMPDVKGLTAKGKAGFKLDTFHRAFGKNQDSSEKLNEIFNDPRVPVAVKDSLVSKFMRDYKQTLEEVSYPGDKGAKKYYYLNSEETKRVQDVDYIMTAIAKYFDKDVARIIKSFKDREPLALVGSQVNANLKPNGDINFELPSFSNVDKDGSQIYNKDDEVQIATQIEYRIGTANLPKDQKAKGNQVVRVAKGYHDFAESRNAVTPNDGVEINGSDISRAVTAVMNVAKNIKPGQTVDSDPMINVQITKALKDSDLLQDPIAVAYVIEKGLPSHIRNPRYRISTSQISEAEHMKQLVLGKQFKMLDLTSEAGSLLQLENDATGLMKALQDINEGRQTYTGLAADLYKMTLGGKDQIRQIMTMLPPALSKKFGTYIESQRGRTFRDAEAAKIAIADYYATVLSFRLATIVQTPPGGAATSVRISDKDRDALAVAIQQNIKLSIQNNATVPIEMIIRENRQRLAIVNNLMSGDRRKVATALLMRNGVYAQQGLYSNVNELLKELVPGNKDSGSFYDKGYTDRLIRGGNIDVTANNDINTNVNEVNKTEAIKDETASPEAFVGGDIPVNVAPFPSSTQKRVYK